jgi:DNA-binding response OmpR family regulator
LAKILVIDDSREFCKLMAMVLKGADHTSVEAYDGPSGVQVADQEQPELILLDYMMPGIDGMETFKQLRDNAHTSHIPVIMITAFSATDTTRLDALRAGMDDFLTKPVSPRALLDSVSTVLYRRHSSPRPVVD